MSAWALIVSSVVVEITTENPAGRFHPDLQWVECDGTSGVAQGWAYSGGTFTAPVAPTPTLAEKAAAMLAAGCQISSGSAATLDGTYPCGADEQVHIQAEVTSILLNGAFTDGSPSIAWQDASGASHTFTVAQFKTLATAIASFVTGCLRVINGQSPTLPTQPSAIA